MDRTRLALVGGLLVLAGCLAVAVPQAGIVDDRFPADGPAADGDRPRDVPADERLTPDVPVSPAETFERLTALLAVEADRPPVEVRELDDDHRYEPAGFYRTMGLDDRPGADLNVTAFYEDGRVTIDPGTASPALVEQVLAHEFVHALQDQGAVAGGDTARMTTDPATTDEQVARQGTVEGVAVWVTHHYAEAHLPNATRTAAVRTAAWRRGPPAAARVAAPYHFGERYVASAVGEPSVLRETDLPRPTTTEQLLHDHAAAGEPPADLSLAVDAGPYAVVESDVQGELATRVVLRAGVGRETARDAAAGWAADRLRRVGLDGSGEEAGYVWAHRWDTGGDAAEFAAAMEHFVDNRTAADPGDVRVVRASDETTVVFVGQPGFVERATADGSVDAVDVVLRGPD